MKIFMVPSIFAGVLLCFVMLKGVVGNQVPNHQRFTQTGYSFMRVPFVYNGQPSSQNLVLSQPSQQFVQYPLPRTASDSSTYSKVTSGTYQPLMYHGVGATSTSTAHYEQPAEYHQRYYPQSVDQESEESQGHQKTPDVVNFQTYRQPELSADSLDEFEEEGTQIQLPLYDAEFLENYFESEGEEQSKDITTNYELISPSRKATSPQGSDAPQGSSTRKKLARIETLRKPDLPTPLTKKFEVLPVQHRNYPIPHPANPEKYVKVDSRLYLNPEFHSDLYSNSDHSIHDSAILPVVKAASEIEQKAVKSHRAPLTSSDNRKQKKSKANEKEWETASDDPFGEDEF